MRSFFQQLEAELSEDLQSITQEADRINRSGRSLQRVTEAIRSLQAHLKENPFENPESEIHYFKETAPPVYGRLFYFYKVSCLETQRQHVSKDSLEAYIRQEIRQLDEFYQRHVQFSHYLHSHQTYMDLSLFTRHRDQRTVLDEVSLLLNDDLCIGTYWAAWLLCNRDLRPYLERLLDEITSPLSATGSGESALPVLEWTGSKTDLAELIKGLHVTEVFNQGKVPFIKIVRWFEAHLGIDLGEVYHRLQETERRKEGVTQYIDRMKKGVVTAWQKKN